MTRVGIVTEWFDRGSAFVSKQIMESLASQGLEVFIYARSEATELKQQYWNAPNLHVGEETRIPFAKSVSKVDFLNWIKINEITHIIFNEQIWLPPVAWAKRSGVACIGYVDYYTKKTVKTFGLYDALICNTSRHKSVFDWHRNSWFIPWGTNLERFKPKIRTQNGEITFVHSAGWSPERKGTDLALEAFLLTSHKNSKLIVHSQADLREALNQMGKINVFNAAAKDPRITLLQHEISPEKLMQLGDVYIYPSRLEGIGLSQAEALASGLPLIVPDEEPMSEFVREPISRTTKVSSRYPRQDGYFWEMVETDLQDLTSNINWFIEHEIERSTWKEIVRASASIYLDAEKNFKELGGLINNLTSDKLALPSYLKSLTISKGLRIQYQFFYPIAFQVRKRLRQLLRKKGSN